MSAAQESRPLCRCGLPALLLLLLGGCGHGVAALEAPVLGLPVAARPVALASTTIHTSPDGGIYQNPVSVEVLLVARREVGALEAQLGARAGAWQPLHRFGPFTIVAVRVRDDGKAPSDPDLGATQLASDYAPAAATGPLARFYHPTFPLAVVALAPPAGDCSVHLEPGRSLVALLVYPPENLPATVVWGTYRQFALSVPVRGALPPLQGQLRAVACSRPQTVPTP